jgi:uncharacterized protein (UPF0548 family)
MKKSKDNNKFIASGTGDAAIEASRKVHKIPTWRLISSWTANEISIRLDLSKDLPLNHKLHQPEHEQVGREHAKGYNRVCSESVVGREKPGPPMPDGRFARGCQSLYEYDFSEPQQVQSHFKPGAPLENRSMLLEIKGFGFKFLGGVRVVSVRRVETKEAVEFGFRYDTLQGHTEDGCEWFIVLKNLETGEIRFKITAAMRPATFPTWWAYCGYLVFGTYFRRQWHKSSHRRMRKILMGAENSDITMTHGNCHLGFSDTPRLN